MSDIETVTVKPKPTCLHKTKLRSLAWLKTLLMFVIREVTTLDTSSPF